MNPRIVPLKHAKHVHFQDEQPGRTQPQGVPSAGTLQTVGDFPASPPVGQNDGPPVAAALPASPPNSASGKLPVERTKISAQEQKAHNDLKSYVKPESLAKKMRVTIQDKNKAHITELGRHLNQYSTKLQNEFRTNFDNYEEGEMRFETDKGERGEKNSDKTVYKVGDSLGKDMRRLNTVGFLDTVRVQVMDNRLNQDVINLSLEVVLHDIGARNEFSALKGLEKANLLNQINQARQSVSSGSGEPNPGIPKLIAFAKAYLAAKNEEITDSAVNRVLFRMLDVKETAIDKAGRIGYDAAKRLLHTVVGVVAAGFTPVAFIANFVGFVLKAVFIGICEFKFVIEGKKYWDEITDFEMTKDMISDMKEHFEKAFFAEINPKFT